MTDTGNDDAATLHRHLTVALALADKLDLALPAIHIEEALAMLADVDATPVPEPAPRHA